MQSASVTNIQSYIQRSVLNKINLSFGGNSHRIPRDICVDLINASNLPYSQIAEGCCLSEPTIRALAEDERHWVQDDTINRIFKFFNFGGSCHSVTIKTAYQNKPKDV